MECYTLADIESSCKQFKTSVVWRVIDTQVNTWQATETMVSFVVAFTPMTNISFGLNE